MSEITTDSVAAELEDILQSVEGLSSGDAGEANKNLGRLFRTVQKLNYLMQIQMAARSSSSNEKPLDESAVAAGSAPGSPLTVSSTPVSSDDNTDVLNDLDEWVTRIGQALSKLAQFLEASQYTIGVQFPFTIDVSITFTP